MTLETFKPAAPVNEAPLRNCGNCVHAYLEQIPGQLIRQLVCHRMPPQVIVIPTPNGYGLQVQSPFVQPQQFCHCHTPKPSANGEAVPIIDP